MENVTLNPTQLTGLIASLPLLLQVAAPQAEEMSTLLHACTKPVVDDADLQGRMALIDQLYAQAPHVGHFAAEFAELVAGRVYEYEISQLQLPNITPGEALAALMRDRRIRQVDLRHIATQSVISEIIHGKRAITVAQIKALAKFFHVPLETFMGHS